MRASQVLRSFTFLLLLASAASAATSQLVLSRDAKSETDIQGVVDLAIDPGFDGATVSVVLDGQNLATGLRSPYHVTVDFGPNPIEHKITVVARDNAGKKVQWSQMINRGYAPLTVKVAPVDLANRVFEATVTAPASDPVATVEFWDNGKVLASLTDAPYRFAIPAENFQTQFVQVTAKTKSGDEAADFWSATGDVHAESVEVRTVPLYVSVVDRNGITHDDVDRSLFRIIDNGSEGKILEFGKAFDQPISIALLVDASSSMTYSMPDATKAAVNFIHRTLKRGDRCAVYSIRGVPRREVPLTSDLAGVEKAITGITASGQTALYDGISSAIRELRGEKNRKAVVVLSDGGDTSSMLSFDEIDRLSKEAGIPLYFIAYDSGAATEQQEVDRMNYLAGETGGFLVTASADNLQAKYG